jgi:peptidoglycan/LPS O-acetylase OafA/YrhL
MRDHALGHSDYFRNLTGLRGFAALWVFVYHMWAYSEPRLMLVPLGFTTIDLTPLFSTGWAGVDVFFVLSAFLLTLPFAHWACGERDFPSPGRYLLKRFRRIFPAFWAQFLILLVLAATTTFYSVPTFRSFAWQTFMYFNLPPSWVAPLNQVWWTLPTEFLFYLLLLPLALLLKTRTGRVVLVLLMSLAWMYRWWVFQNFHDEGVGRMVILMGNTLGCLDQFIAGTFCAWFFVKHHGRGKLPVPPIVFLGLGILGMLTAMYSVHWLYDLYWAGHPLMVLKNTLLGVSICSILIACQSGSRLADILFGNRLIVHLGIISYSIYLWHYPLLHMLNQMAFFKDWEGYRLPMVLAIAVPITWLLSYTSYRWIERPFLKSPTKPKSG